MGQGLLWPKLPPSGQGGAWRGLGEEGKWWVIADPEGILGAQVSLHSPPDPSSLSLSPCPPPAPPMGPSAAAPALVALGWALSGPAN